MVARPTVEYFDMEVRSCPLGEAIEEIVHEFGLEITDSLHSQLQIDNGMYSSAKIDRGDTECFVHRHDKVAGTINTATRAKCFRHSFTQGDADIFDRVVLVDV